MASSAENRAVNLAGLVQGITLVTFPAASSIFTDSSEYGLSGTQYGAMFVPQVLTAIATSLLGGALAHRFTAKRVLLLGLAANITSMVLLVVTAGFKTEPVAYPLLLVATAFLGAGFGLTVPVLNTYVAAFRPDRADRAVLVLNALLGLGTALAPVFVVVFVGLGFWWGLPVLSTVLLVLLLLASARLPLRAGTGAAGVRPAQRAGIPPRFWLFAAFAVLYGLCETMNGNWSQLDMTSLGASTTQAALALTTFWAMITVGRLLFAAIVRWLPARAVFHMLPIVLVATFLLIAALPEDAPWLGVAAFGLAGLGCSALLPLTISLAQDALTTMSAAVAGGVIAFYQVGYGIAAFGVGPLVDGGTSLSTIYGWTAVAAAGLALLSFAATRRQPSPQPATSPG
ncbi:MAG TPA: MFS transporter [Jiangellaceae bacterium]|nr:MFS transporter [Jiangellaceae bacterium]